LVHQTGLDLPASTGVEPFACEARRVEQTTQSSVRVRAVLGDPRYHVPTVPDDSPPGTLGWIRARIPRFADGAEHDRRRALAERLIGGLEPDHLRWLAAQRTRALSRSMPEERVVEAVPVLVLAETLGMLGGGVDAPGLLEATLCAARSYLPHLPQEPAADEAATVLVEAARGATDEETAIRASLLLQSCLATANLVRNARRVRRSPADAARSDPPVRSTRRIGPDGETLELDLTAPVAGGDPSLAFGAGAHACPGQAQALAIASGILDSLPGSDQ